MNIWFKLGVILFVIAGGLIAYSGLKFKSQAEAKDENWDKKLIPMFLSGCILFIISAAIIALKYPF